MKLLDRKLFAVSFSFLLFLALWESFTFLFPKISTPYVLFSRTASEWSIFYPHINATFLEMAIGTAIAVLSAFIFAYLMFRYKLVRILLEPYFVIMRCLPMFVLAPLFLMFFGWSLTAVIIPTALMIAFPLTMSLYKGLSMTPQNYLDYFRLHGATERKLFFSLRMPFALPHFFAGFRIACASAGIGALGGEWAGAQEGLGVLMQIYRRQFDIEGVFIAIICLLFLTLLFYLLAVGLEKIVFKGNHEFIKEADRSLCSSHNFNV